MGGDEVYLTQTDTTAGFLSQSPNILLSIKKREQDKPFITILDSMSTLRSKFRINKKFRKFVRNSKKTSFVLEKNNFSFRVCPNTHPHHDFVKKYRSIYTTSANLAGKKFDIEFALKNCSTIVLNHLLELEEKESSKIIKINNRKMKKLRG